MAKKFSRAEIRRIVGENCTDEIENELVALHLGVIDPLKDEIDKYKQAEGKPTEADEWRQKYEKEHTDFETFKQNTEAEKVLTAKREAYKSVAKDAGLSEKGIEKALKYADFSSIELDDDGKVKDAKTHIKNLKEEWAEHIVTTETVGANTATPPTTNTGSTVMTKTDIYKKDDKGHYIMSATERQNALNKLLEQKGF